ncbi:sulfotransferase domain-containing protein [Neptunicoccus sediminis]|uniref:sulfotransferase domain-containing protein n=1 Tax=Neptunicoccus sediminis TaxID=1892596 RepID=UPI000845E8AC|nr:sulfotransferase domain-containing protein [Neptunicoccus sediminis]
MSNAFQNKVEKARNCMRTNKWHAACDLWDQIRYENPLHRGAYIEGINALIRAYRHDEIDALALQAREMVGDYFQVQFFLAGLACRRGQWTTSVKEFEALIGKFPSRKSEVMNSTTYRQAVLNSVGIIAGNRKLAPLSHAEFMKYDGNNTSPSSYELEYVFVSGMPRAGTTALGHLLNMSPDIALFTEIHIPYLNYKPSSFSQEILEKRAVRLPAGAPPKIVKKLSQAKLIGDKRPLFHYMLPQTLQAMREHRVTVFQILRSVLNVAVSYQNRANSPEDQWDPLRNLNNAIDEFNVMHRFILEWESQGEMQPHHKIFYIDYSKVFTEMNCATGLFDCLGQTVDENLKHRIAQYIQHSNSIMAKERRVEPEVLAQIRDRIDMNAACEVVKLTGIDVIDGLS